MRKYRKQRGSEDVSGLFACLRGYPLKSESKSLAYRAYVMRLPKISREQQGKWQKRSPNTPLDARQSLFLKKALSSNLTRHADYPM